MAERDELAAVLSEMVDTESATRRAYLDWARSGADTAVEQLEARDRLIGRAIRALGEETDHG